MNDVSSTILSELDYLPQLKGRTDRRIGVVGTGRIALQRQIPCYQNAGLEVVAVADLKQEALDEAAETFDIARGFLDYRDLLACDDIDIVDICTNTFPRKRITLDALAAGKHVLSEKPFARSCPDAMEMVEVAEAAGVTLAVHQPTRWYYPCAITRELVTRGLLGDPYYIECRMMGNQDTAYYEDPVTRWHADLEDHIFVEWGAHHFDMQRWLSGGETPASVFAWGTTRGNEHFRSKMAVSATCNFASGIVGSLSLNQASRFPDVGGYAVGLGFRVEGTEGTATGDMVYGVTFKSRLRGGIEATFDFNEPLSEEEDPYRYMWCPSVRDGHLWPMVELINSLNEGREPINSGRDNVKSVATYLAAMQSDAEGRQISPGELIRAGGV